MSLFTLQVDNWYAVELIKPSPVEVMPQFMPLLVEKTVPRKTGKHLLGLQGYTPLGEFRADLHVLQRASHHLVAKVGEENTAVFYPITFDWLIRYCPNLVTEHPLPSEPHYPSDATYYLDTIFVPHMTRQAFVNYRDKTIHFRCPDFQRAKAVNLPLVVEAKHLLALQQKAAERVKFYFPQNQELTNHIVFDVEYSEAQVLNICALRFDGYTYTEQVLRGHTDIFQVHLAQGTISDEPNLQMAQFFHLQRYLGKWGGEHEPLHSRAWRLFRALFLTVVNHPVPPEFQFPEYYTEWLHNYEPYRAQCIELVKHIHDTTAYDDALPVIA